MAAATSQALVSGNKNVSRTALSTSNLPFLSIHAHRRAVSLICSSRSSFPLLEDASNEFSIAEWRFEFPTVQTEPPWLSDPVDFNQAIRDLCQDPRTEALAYESYLKAKNHPDFRPDPLTLNFLVRYFLKLKQWSSLAVLAEDFGNFRLFPYASTCAKMVSGCVEARRFKVSEILLGVFELEGKLAVPVFDAAMRSYNKLHMYGNTILVYERMRTTGILPDASCYYRVMKACWRTGDAERVLALFKELNERKMSCNEISRKIFWILCESLGKSGRAEEALKYFREMLQKGVSHDSSFYSSLIVAFANNKDVQKAEELLEEAKGKGMIKDPAIFLKLVLMYVEKGMVEKSLELVRTMTDMKIRVSDCIFCAVINGFAKKRGFKPTIRAYFEMVDLGCEPGQVTYASMVNVYGRSGLFSKAEAVFTEMVEKGFDKCVVAYANMVSIYGKVGRLKDAVKLVAKMKERGCEPNVWVYNSLIDLNGRAMNLRQVEKLWKEMKRRKVAPDKVTYTSMISAYSRAKEFEECGRLYRDFRLNGGRIDLNMAGIMVNVFSKSGRVDELVELLQDMKSEGARMDGKLYRSAINSLRDSGLQAHVTWFKESFGQSSGSKTV